jgi:hypothetical protein
MRRILTIAATVATGLALESGAQAPPATDSAPAKPISTTLGLVVFPAKDQTKETQATDETSCYAWSKQQTGIDPFATPASTPAQPQTAAAPEQKAGGERLRGAAKGAAAGAVIGEIADDDAGEGAAIGAAAGVVAGGRQKRKAEAQAQQQAAAQQQEAAAHAQQATADQKAMFNKGFTACLESKGYTVK